MSVVIPTTSTDTPATCRSLPEVVETTVVRRGGRAEARNIGAKRSDGEILVFCDDDIAFSERWFADQIARVDRGEVRALEDYGAGYILTRFLAIHREDFERVGGFDPRLNHMEDTDFGMRADRAGLLITRLPRGDVEHFAHENDVTTFTRAKSMAYLTAKHRHRFVPVAKKILS